MRFSGDEIHPILWRATDALSTRWASGITRTPEEKEVMTRHSGMWMKQYGLGCAATLSPMLLTIPAIILAKNVFPRGAAPLLVLMGFFALGGWLAYEVIKRNKRVTSAAELANMLPALDLDPVGRAYAETVVALGESGVPESDAKETLATLNSVLDEAGRLDEAVATPIGPMDDLEGERLRLERFRDEETDPAAREMYEESLRLVEVRAGGRGSGGMSRARADAQKELIRQTILSVRDTLRSGREAARGRSDTSVPDVRALMERVAAVRREADATARAADEIRAL